jgi:hypothetical protein
MRLFRTRARTFLEPELEDWHVSAWRWLLDGMGGVDGLRDRPLVTPTRAFFPPAAEDGHGRVAHVFAQVKLHAGMAAWECGLVAQPEQSPLLVGEMVALERSEPAPAGTFGLEGNAPLITYDPSLADDPLKLVAVLIHELAHLRLMDLGLPPGGEACVERATDLATVALGFGLFGSNCAFGFERYQGPISQGWRSARLGYLEEREWAFALAVFLTLTGRDVGETKRYLKGHLFADLGRAVAVLRARPAALAAVVGEVT